LPRALVNDVAGLISQDLSLSYQVLRCINSSYYGVTRKVESIHQATVMLGLEKLRQLCALVALTQIEDRPISIFIDAMTRARMCEQLGMLRGAAESASLFIVGLFSLLDVVTGIAMDELLEQLPLSASVSQALRTQQGPLGQLLREVIAYERGLWTPDLYPGPTPAELQNAYLDAIAWAQSAYAITSG